MTVTLTIIHTTRHTHSVNASCSYQECIIFANSYTCELAIQSINRTLQMQQSTCAQTDRVIDAQN